MFNPKGWNIPLGYKVHPGGPSSSLWGKLIFLKTGLSFENRSVEPILQNPFFIVGIKHLNQSTSANVLKLAKNIPCLADLQKQIIAFILKKCLQKMGLSECALNDLRAILNFTPGSQGQTSPPGVKFVP
jgi:hypothetical protein